MAIYQKTGGDVKELKVNGVKEAYLATSAGKEKLWSSFTLPVFTGAHAIFGDEKKGRIQFYESGTVTLANATYDLFCVGGGRGHHVESYQYTAGGGGYTKTKLKQKLGGILSVTIGAGGVYASGESGRPNSAGKPTSIADILTANGATYSGAGGSGGGASAYRSNGGDGGSDGTNGGSAVGQTDTNSGGRGQGTTTRAFGEENNTLYAGGGAGGVSGTDAPNAKPGTAGAGGGGKGSYSDRGITGTDGTPNTGGGCGGVYLGTGGSGIAIIRWGY